MTETQLRQKKVEIMQSWIGKKESDGSHKMIIDIYNDNKPLARGYAVKYTDAWCAATDSAATISAGLTDIIPIECSCSKMIELAKDKGIWVENDAYVPQPGDSILYDWDDNGIGDNTGYPEHIGVVEKVSGNMITVIEGNKNNAVGRRELQVNGKYIRGFIAPDYRSKAIASSENNTSETTTSTSLKVGDTVNFTGNKHYSSANVTSGKSCKSGKAKITQIYQLGKSKHPYHVTAVSGGGSNVFGWVDEVDIEGVISNITSEIKVGDVVNFSGSKHYTSSYATATGRACRGGTAKVTAINKDKAHPYHLVHTGSGCTVYGWVDAEDVTGI